MDEYRPYPTVDPLDSDGDQPAADAAGAGAAPAEERAAGTAAPRAPRGATERQAPDLTHPGGHLTGTVARINRPRRFGFLKADDGAEVFFHASALDTGPSGFDALRPGQPVEFDCHQDEQGRGLAATLVTITGEPPEPAARQRQSRQERQERQGRKASGTQSEPTNWHVTVLRERSDSPLASQLERLLNEQRVKPGQFTLTVVEREASRECWVAYYTGDEKK